MTIPEDLEPLAIQLDAHTDYKVLRRHKPREKYVEHDPGESVFRGVYLDIETTGFDLAKATAIELGMVPFDYSSAGQVMRVYNDTALSQFNDPGEPIPEEVVRLTGITNEMVAGQVIDDAAVEACARDANLIIAHNASFDRPIAERHWPVLAQKNWACSVSDVPWKDEGVTSAKLDYVAMELGFFFEGHRALDDCLAGIEVLARELPTSGRTVLSTLLENARTPTVQISADGAPFEVKAKAAALATSANNIANPDVYLPEDPKEPTSAKSGHLYVMRCPLMEDDIYKVGFTTNNPKQRAEEFSSATGVPMAYIVVESWGHDNARDLEKRAHIALDDLRINFRREFFKASYETIRKRIESVIKNN